MRLLIWIPASRNWTKRVSPLSSENEIRVGARWNRRLVPLREESTPSMLSPNVMRNAFDEKKLHPRKANGVKYFTRS
jgi:hypothetical protein